jgi:dihydrofolate synthase/folylpolyglutamate synthase
MNFSESLAYLYQRGNEVLTMNLGLETIRCLCTELGDPQESFPAVHVAGTNGKGSTVAMTEAILRAAGLRTGLYTSPHLLSVTERIQVAGQPIPTEDFARLATRVRQAGERLLANRAIPALPTFFEQVTAIGYLWFAEQQLDLAVLEVGLGGRLDATNLCRPIVTAITPIGFDHQEYLGHTLAAIAGEKAGILKPGVPVVIAPQDAEALSAILARAAAVGAPVLEPLLEAKALRSTPALRQWVEFRIGEDSLPVLLSLRGTHQIINARVAVSIVEALRARGWSIPLPAVAEGLAHTSWPGRLDLRVGPAGHPLLLDGAHNAAGAQVLRDFLLEFCADRPRTLLFGAMRDKDIPAITGLLFPLFDHLILCGIDNPRALDPAEIPAPDSALHAPSALDALALASHLSPPNGLIVVAGSIAMVATLTPQPPLPGGEGEEEGVRGNEK